MLKVHRNIFCYFNKAENPHWHVFGLWLYFLESFRSLQTYLLPATESWFYTDNSDASGKLTRDHVGSQ